MTAGKTHTPKRSVSYYLAIIWVSLLVICVFFADFIANENPILLHNNSGWLLTIYGVPPSINQEEYHAINAWVGYSPDQLDYDAARYKPFFLKGDGPYDDTHLLGTDELGRDILSGLIHGTRTSIFVAFLAMLFATFNGVVLGGLSGFVGDRGVKVSWRLLASIALSAGLSYFYAWYVRQYSLSDAFSQGLGAALLQLGISLLMIVPCIGLGWLAYLLLTRKGYLSRQIHLPVDLILQRVIELFTSIPRLFLILAIVTIASPSLFLFAMIIGLTFWTSVAKLVRAEMIKIREYTYVEAAKAIGLSNFWIFMRHALPNVYKMIAIYFAFGLASTIMMESTLSFLGAGIPADTVSWGKMLSKFSMLDWWKSVIPGAAIILTVLAFHRLGERNHFRNKFRHL